LIALGLVVLGGVIWWWKGGVRSEVTGHGSQVTGVRG
jgi:hypothetical protein